MRIQAHTGGVGGGVHRDGCRRGSSIDPRRQGAVSVRRSRADVPAGRYSVNDSGGVVQFRGESGEHSNVFVLTHPASGHDPAGNSPALTFRRSRTVPAYGGLGIEDGWARNRSPAGVIARPSTTRSWLMRGVPGGDIDERAKQNMDGRRRVRRA